MTGRHTRRSPRNGRAPFALALAALLIAPFAMSASAASWADQEHVNGPLSTQDCTTPGYVSEASGVLVGGEVLGTSLAPIAEVAGANAESDGTGGTVEDSDPLAVSALSAINADLGGVLQFDLGAETGVLRQFALASPLGNSAGSAGAVADAGGIDLEEPTPGDPVPRFATLELGEVLSALLGSGLGGGITGLADARLQLGAVASYATLDGCAANWDDSVYANLERDYLVAGLGLELDSPLVSDLAGTVTSGTTTIDGLVSAVAGEAGLVNSLTGATMTALAPTLSLLGVGAPITTLTLDTDLSAVAGELVDPIEDSQGILSIDLLDGTVTVDLARLLGPSYENSVGLNGLAPNTELLLNATAVSALLTAVDSALADWTDGIVDTIDSAVDVVTVDLTVTAPLSVGVPSLGLTVPVGTITVSIVDAGLDDLLAGDAEIGVGVALTPPSCSGLDGIIICGVVNPILTGLTTAVTNLVLDETLGPVLGGLIAAALDPVPGLATLETDLGLDIDALLAFLENSLDGLFGQDALLSLVVNAQNAPDPSEVSVPPGVEPSWTGLDAASTSPYRTGEFSVAALRLVTLGVLSGGVAVDLARSSVGSNGPG